MILLNRFIPIEVRTIKNNKLNLSDYLKIDESINLPSSFKDGSHLSILFALTHNEEFRGKGYKGLNNSNEMGLLSYLLENKDIDINIDSIIKMYQILTNDKEASFRKDNVRIVTGEKFYVPTSKDNVEKEMTLLCDKYQHLNHPNMDDFDDVFKFILNFICIHPFENGNGRLSVFLMELLLRKFNLNNALYLPLDALLNGVFINRTTFEIRKASGFFYKMKDYEYDSYIDYMKEVLMKSYELLIKISS